MFKPSFDEKCSRCGRISNRTFHVDPHICSRCFAESRAEARAKDGSVVWCVSDYGEDDGDTPFVMLTCSECRHKTFAWGQEFKSLKRCYYAMFEECPRKEKNTYKVQEIEDEWNEWISCPDPSDPIKF